MSINLHEPNRWLNDANGRVMHHYQIYECLGLNPKAHLPDEYRNAGYIGNVQVWMNPPDNGKHRVMARCPVCSNVFAFGRLRQHLKIHV